MAPVVVMPTQRTNEQTGIRKKGSMPVLRIYEDV